MIDPLTTNNAIYRDSLTLITCKEFGASREIINTVLFQSAFVIHKLHVSVLRDCVLIKLNMSRDEIFFSIAINEIRQLKFEVVQAKIDDKKTVWYIRKTKKSGSAK